MLVTQAEFGRMHDVSAVAVSKWKGRGKLVMEGGLVDVEASNERLRRLRNSEDPRATRGKALGSLRETTGKQPGNIQAAMTATEIRAELAALDWRQKFEWSGAALGHRVSLAAKCAGLEAVLSETRDDGHWGGYQLRNRIAMERNGGPCYEAIEAGFGFELEPYEVLEHCRQALCDDSHADDELIEVNASLLPMLAYPFGEWQINLSEEH
ncbi:hypothetical protein [Bordetella sp.]|uniref:hypothetical protein n=1 Tax=Bordetella sp. TaxID=28081 RepID=UPI003F7CC8FC